MNDNRHQAISDCKYALSLSEISLDGHFRLWLNLKENEEYVGWTQDDQEYLLTLQEIQAKLHTNECLLREGD